LGRGRGNGIVRERVIVHVKDAKTYAGVGKIVANGEFDCGKTFV
jgi:hypothetical protein